MTYEEFASLPVGAKVKCINGKGWISLKKGEVYTVTENWTIGLLLDEIPVLGVFFEDFIILYEGEE